MDLVTGDLDNAFTYLDDLMVFSKSLEDNESHLLQVFSRFRDHGLVINLEKCVFGATSVDFLGHKVSSAGVRPLPAYVDTVDKFPKPTCIKELQTFFFSFICLLTFHNLIVTISD
jgi:hypothetical protein